MDRTQPWEALYPPSLQNYKLDLSAMPAHPADFAAEAANLFGSQRAFTIVLPSGHTASLDFTQVDELSDRLAGYFLEDLKLTPGEVVAIQLPNILHYPLAVFGAWKAGLIVTLVNPLYSPREVQQQLADSGAKALIACDLFLKSPESVAATSGVRLVVASLWDFFPVPVSSAVRTALQNEHGNLTLPAGGARFVDAICDVRASRINARNDVVLYQYTGGTTGRSKAAVITVSNVRSILRMTEDFLAAYGGEYKNGTNLTVLPLYHIFAFVLGFLAHFRGGSHNVLIPSPRPLSNLKPAFDSFSIDWVAGVDTLFAGLLAEPWFIQRPPRLRYALTGGAAIRPTTANAWEEKVGPMIEGYGMTESTCIIACNPPNATHRIGSVGVPLPGCDVKMVDTADAEVRQGEAGELLVRGPQMIQAYRALPEENAQAFTNGWFRTGDIARIADDGYIEIVDRKKDMVLVSGFNVYPNEVESVISAHPAVVEVAVIGVADDKTGEAVKAFIVGRQADLNVQDIIEHCRQNLAAYKVPKYVVVRDVLPKSPVGKILRAQLRAE